MDDDYYSLQSILAENHKMPCAFTLDVPGLGYLEGGTEPNLRALTKVELPFWLLQTLAVHDFASFGLPLPYSTRVKAALLASAPSVKISALVGSNGWWYRWGTRIAETLDATPGAELLAWLLVAFVQRLGPLQDLAAHHASSDRSLGESGSGSGEGFMDSMEGDERIPHPESFHNGSGVRTIDKELVRCFMGIPTEPAIMLDIGFVEIRTLGKSPYNLVVKSLVRTAQFLGFFEPSIAVAARVAF